MPVFCLLRVRETTVKRRGAERGGVITQNCVFVFLGVEIVCFTSQSHQIDGKITSNFIVSLFGAKLFQYYSQSLDTRQNTNFRLNMYTKPKRISAIEILVKNILQSSPIYGDLSQEFEQMFWEEHFYWEKLEDCYRQITTDWKNLDSQNFKLKVEGEAKRYAEARTKFESDATGIYPIDTFEEFHIISGANESEVLYNVAMSLNLPLTDENLPKIQDELKELRGYIEELKDDLKMLFWHDCICRLYKIAVDGSLFEESVTSKQQQSNTKQKGKTSPTLSHKQQMVLLNQLNFLDAPIFEKLTTEKKAEILGNLLNRNIQETRKLLTYFNDPKGTHEQFSNTPENQEVVGRLLEHNNLTFADKKE